MAGENRVVALSGGEIREFALLPEDVGLPRAPVAAIRGGDAATNAAALLALLNGAPGAYRDTVLLNAGAAIAAGGKAKDIAEGVKVAEASIASGAARQRLERLVAFCAS